MRPPTEIATSDKENTTPAVILAERRAAEAEKKAGKKAEKKADKKADKKAAKKRTKKNKKK